MRGERTEYDTYFTFQNILESKKLLNLLYFQVHGSSVRSMLHDHFDDFETLGAPPRGPMIG